MGPLAAFSGGMLSGGCATTACFSAWEASWGLISNPREKGNDYARICVEIDLSKPLPDAIDMCAGSYSWVQ